MNSGSLAPDDNNNYSLLSFSHTLHSLILYYYKNSIFFSHLSHEGRFHKRKVKIINSMFYMQCENTVNPVTLTYRRDFQPACLCLEDSI